MHQTAFFSVFKLGTFHIHIDSLESECLASPRKRLYPNLTALSVEISLVVFRLKT